MLFGNVIKTTAGDYYVRTLSDDMVQYIKLNHVHDNDVLWISEDLVEEDLHRNKDFIITTIYEDFTLKKVLFERKVPEKSDDTLSSLKTLGFKYIARDQDNDLYAYTSEPDRMDDYWANSGDGVIALPKDKFPDVTWETGLYEIK